MRNVTVEVFILYGVRRKQRSQLNCFHNAARLKLTDIAPQSFGTRLLSEV
jgi:hypothetical protein